MRMIPILYSIPMVQAIQENRKTKTRRTKGLEKLNESPDNYRYNRPTNNFDEEGFGYHIFLDHKINTRAYIVKCPYGQVGDILWVRENFYTASNWDHWKPSGLQLVNAEVFFQADIPNYDISRPLSRGKMRPNIFLPFYYARIFLKIKSVTVERLQDITEADAMAEGIKMRITPVEYETVYQIPNCPNFFPTAKKAFLELWKSINGKESIDLNPWVWVIEFEKVEKPENFN